MKGYLPKPYDPPSPPWGPDTPQWAVRAGRRLKLAGVFLMGVALTGGLILIGQCLQ